VRRAVLDAALHELALHGPAGTSLERVAEAAGVTKPMVHYYFGSKDGLCRAVCVEAFAALDAAVLSVASPAGDASEGLWELVRAQLTLGLDALRVVCRCLQGAPTAFMSAADLYAVRRRRREALGRVLAGADVASAAEDALALLLDGALAALVATLTEGESRDAVLARARDAVSLLGRGLARERR
jgi:AcrR family transcriptional regulator